MEKGNEGDEIIFLSFRQAEIPIPPNVNSVRELSADQSIEIISRSLYLISNGDVKFPLTLPANIATRHRICTSVAQKIKELGFLSECGYNQLLYPVESQTREILTFIVEKLPRVEDEGAQEVLGANALMNRKISQSLLAWKQSPWKLPVALSHRPALRPHGFQRFRTAPQAFNAKEARTSDIFRVCAESKLYLESSVFERNTASLVSDALAAARLEADLHHLENEDEAGTAGGKDATQNAIKAALAKLTKGTGGGSGKAQRYDEDGNVILEEEEGTVSSEDVLRANQLSSSLQDLIANITNSYGPGGKGGAGDDSRGTRFSHAIEFAQEASTSVAGTLRGVGGGARPGFAASLGAIDIGDSGDAAARKAAKEAEEKERQDELEALRGELTKAVGGVEDAIKGQALLGNKIKQYEADIARLAAETEALEKSVIIKRKTLEMLPSAAENIKKLQTICNASQGKLTQLEAEWETHKGPLVEQLRVKKGAKAMRRAKCRGLVDEMKKCREDMVTMIQDLKDKQDRAQMLTEEMSKLPKNINRAIYTHRIMDITSSIVKQNKDIAKITQDIRDIQKTINLNSSTLQRADAVTEDLIYSAANDKNDPVMVDTYRRLRTLRAKFDELCNTVAKIGQAEKAARDLETKVDQEKARISSNNFDRIKADLEAIQKENAQLVAQIKAGTKK